MASSPLRIGGSTFSFIWREPAASALERMLEIGLNDFDALIVPGHLWAAELSGRDRATLRQRFASLGIRLESLNLPALDLNLASSVTEVRSYSVSMYRDALHLSAELGARAVVVVPGRVSSLLPPDLEDTLAWLADTIGALLKVADELGQDIYLELHPQTPVPTADKIGAFVDLFDTPRLTVAYDIANAEYVGEDYGKAIRSLGRRIGQFHLSDTTRAAWRHDALGRGTVDIAAAIEAINAIGFSGVTVLEVISPAPIAEIGASLAVLAAAQRCSGLRPAPSSAVNQATQ
jgi:L-ribulose-5-phosphate 3-epimerase